MARIGKVGFYWDIEMEWPRITAARILKTGGLAMLLLGFISLFASAVYDSYVTALMGLGLAFWGVLLLLIMPTKHVKLELLTAASSSLAANLEEMLNVTAFNSKGIYLPPKLLRDYQSSLIFIPANGRETMPRQEGTPEIKAPTTSNGLLLTPPDLAADVEKMFGIVAFNGKEMYLSPKPQEDYSSSLNPPSLIFDPAKETEMLPKREDVPDEKAPRTSKGLFLTPPGLALSRLFEKQLGKSFTELDLNQLTTELPRLFEELDITKNSVVRVEGDSVTVEATNHVFKDLCEETRKLETTHRTVGCPFSSAIACAVAKAAGKPVTIEKEEQSQDGKTTTIQYRTMEE